METTIKLSIAIDQNNIGYYGRGEIIITDMLFSESSFRLMDADDLVGEVKKSIKAMKGWSMITISLSDDVKYTTYPKQIHSVRFTNSYGDIKIASVNGNCYDNWNTAKIKDVYDNIKTFVKNANNFQLGKVRQSNNTEVSNAD